MTTLHLSDEQAALYVLFMKNFDNISFLLANEALDLKRGNVTVNFDNDGKIVSIEKHTYVYAKKHPHVDIAVTNVLL